MVLKTKLMHRIFFTAVRLDCVGVDQFYFDPVRKTISIFLSYILVVLIFWLFSILVIFHFGRFPLWSSSILFLDNLSVLCCVHCLNNNNAVSPKWVISRRCRKKENKKKRKKSRWHIAWTKIQEEERWWTVIIKHKASVSLHAKVGNEARSLK